jgi:putative oxidoreductase
MLNRLLVTNNSWAMLLIRLPIGINMLVHGYAKITNVAGTMRYFDGLGINHFFGWLAIIAEFFGGIGLIVGCLSRIAAFGVACTMVVAIFERHIRYGYLMNWHGALPYGTEGWEMHTLSIGMCAGIMLAGAGALSVDRLLVKLLNLSAEELKEPIRARDREGAVVTNFG